VKISTKANQPEVRRQSNSITSVLRMRVGRVGA
jgi:hypothetical protein